MNLSVEQASLLVEQLAHSIEHSDHDIVLCPGYLAVYPIYQMIRQRGLDKLFGLGVQNINDHDEGAFTGEVSGTQVRDFVDYVIIGHSERRRYFHEDDAVVAKKLEAALRHELIPILCVGETLTEHEAGAARQAVALQLEQDLNEVSPADSSSLVIAYEPIWAIGNDNFDKPDDANAMMGFIRQQLVSRFGDEQTKKIKVLYGGSVDDENAVSYLKQNNCDGLLVGHNSINPEQFARIAHA